VRVLAHAGADRGVRHLQQQRVAGGGEEPSVADDPPRGPALRRDQLGCLLPGRQHWPPARGESLSRGSDGTQPITRVPRKAPVETRAAAGDTGRAMSEENVELVRQIYADPGGISTGA